MSVRRSGRLNPGFDSGQNTCPAEEPEKTETDAGNDPADQSETQLNKKEPSKERYFNSPQMQKLHQDSKDSGIHKKRVEPSSVVSATEFPDKNVSATTKALNQKEGEGGEKKKKQVKMSIAFKKKKLNQKLARLLMPKNAVILLHEIKPDCTFKVFEISGSAPSFCVQVEYNNVVLGTGRGLSKSQAKNSAAENAIKTIVSQAMSSQSVSSTSETDGEETTDNDSFGNLPWAGLASFAIFKMFSEWQSQGTDILSMARRVSKPKVKAISVNTAVKKDLPPNAAELHPSAVLNMMCPGLSAVEIERKDGPNSQVKMGYTVDGKMYTGLAGNKKDAKKEAAKTVLLDLYGLTYPS